MQEENFRPSVIQCSFETGCEHCRAGCTGLSGLFELETGGNRRQWVFGSQTTSNDYGALTLHAPTILLRVAATLTSTNRQPSPPSTARAGRFVTAVNDRFQVHCGRATYSDARKFLAGEACLGGRGACVQSLQCLTESSPPVFPPRGQRMPPVLACLSLHVGAVPPQHQRKHWLGGRPATE